MLALPVSQTWPWTEGGVGECRPLEPHIPGSGAGGASPRHTLSAGSSLCTGSPSAAQQCSSGRLAISEGKTFLYCKSTLCTCTIDRIPFVHLYREWLWSPKCNVKCFHKYITVFLFNHNNYYNRRKRVQVISMAVTCIWFRHHFFYIIDPYLLWVDPLTLQQVTGAEWTWRPLGVQ